MPNPNTVVIEVGNGEVIGVYSSDLESNVIVIDWDCREGGYSIRNLKELAQPLRAECFNDDEIVDQLKEIGVL